MEVLEVGFSVLEVGLIVLEIGLAVLEVGLAVLEVGLEVLVEVLELVVVVLELVDGAALDVVTNFVVRIVVPTVVDVATKGGFVTVEFSVTSFKQISKGEITLFNMICNNMKSVSQTDEIRTTRDPELAVLRTTAAERVIRVNRHGGVFHFEASIDTRLD